MTRFTRAGFGAALLLPVIVAIGACGGGTTTATSTTTTPTGVAEGSPDGLSSLPPGAIPSFDLGALTGAIPGVDSYRTSVSVNGQEQYQSVVVTEPEVSKAITTFEDDGSVDTRYILIGKEAWTAEGADGAFTSIPEALAGPMLMFLDPAAMLGAYANLDWAKSATDVGIEDKNGVRARHVKIDATTVGGLGVAMPPGSSVDVWIAEAGYLVAWEMSGFEEAQDISIQITGVNDPANKVERPA